MLLLPMIMLKTYCTQTLKQMRSTTARMISRFLKNSSALFLAKISGSIPSGFMII